ncbi:hypothetical protein [Kiloniella majae]|uniref:hypothetical protein n=1 Tax=Kiloniella majae TaxID=1938558 RepID=UPI000A2787B9|nr:hypothetical protein [Kiloniella majae]
MPGPGFLAGPPGGGLPSVTGGPAVSGADSYSSGFIDYNAPFTFGGSGIGGAGGAGSNYVWPLVVVVLVGIFLWKK